MSRGNVKILFLFLLIFVFISILSLNLTAEVREETKSVVAKRIDSNLKIDGRLDEQEWSNAPVIGPITQVIPREGDKPSQETEVKILYNSTYLYISIICYEDPSKIIAYQLERDSDPYADDYVGFILDTFLDKSNCYVFAVSPAGMKADGTIVNNVPEIHSDWDGIWWAEVEVTDKSWNVEIAIPFQTLSFDKSNTIWGFNVARGIKRFEETDRWAYPYLDADTLNPALAGEIRGLEGMEQGVGLDIRPFAVAKASKPEPTENSEFSPDGGIDVFYNVAPNLKASITVNTDFAETEVDERQINLTRFPIKFPEKRDFFLEGADLFSMPRMQDESIPFFSRTIGLYEGEEIPVQWGTKLTGRIGPYNIGLLDVQTGSKDGLEGDNLFVMRVTRNLWDQSHIGIIFTNGNPGREGSNRLYGLDFRYGTSKLFGDKNFYATANYLMTEDESLPDEDTSSWKVSLDYPNDLIDTFMDYSEIGENFRPALGYLRRSGIKVLETGFSLKPRIDFLGIRQIATSFYLESAWNGEQELVESFLEIEPIYINFDSGDTFEFTIQHNYDLLDQDFEISDGISIPAAEYSFTNYAFEVSTASKRPLQAILEYQWGDYYGGSASEFFGMLMFRPNKHIFFGANSWFSDVELPEGSFIARIYEINLILKLNPNVSWRNLIQYDNFSEMLGIYSKIRWILEEGNELYFVVQHNWKLEDDQFMPYNWRIDLKFYYTFRF